jgi:hypothetical protein
VPPLGVFFAWATLPDRLVAPTNLNTTAIW